MEGSDGRTSPVEPGGQVEPMAELQALLARVEAATGPDRALSNAIRAALFPPKAEVIEHEGHLVTLPAGWGSGFEPDLTGSLDAALALVERVLPGWELELTSEFRDDAVIWRVMLGDPLRGMDGESSTPALALLAALLRALVSDNG